MADRSRILDSPARAPRPTLRAWLDREVASLHPGCFALVMATGIISNAFFLEGRHVVRHYSALSVAPDARHDREV